MSLSDRDIELAKKHSEYRIGAGDYCFTEDEFKAFLAERDQLAIKEKDDAVREALAKYIYEQWASHDGYVPWVDGGNSLMQDKARAEAIRALIK